MSKTQIRHARLGGFRDARSTLVTMSIRLRVAQIAGTRLSSAPQWKASRAAATRELYSRWRRPSSSSTKRSRGVTAGLIGRRAGRRRACRPFFFLQRHPNPRRDICPVIPSDGDTRVAVDLNFALFVIQLLCTGSEPFVLSHKSSPVVALQPRRSLRSRGIRLNYRLPRSPNVVQPLKG